MNADRANDGLRDGGADAPGPPQDRKEINAMLKRGAHDIFINEADDAAFQKFNDADIDSILESSSTKVTCRAVPCRAVPCYAVCEAVPCYAMLCARPPRRCAATQCAQAASLYSQGCTALCIWSPPMRRCRTRTPRRRARCSPRRPSSPTATRWTWTTLTLTLTLT
eukprot:scaffold48936_cov75-Phaeocystis_antarctica.AAC.1